jgi:hypothetical protein
MKHVSAASDIDSMSGVVSSLVPGDTMEVFRQDIDDLAFAFITPLNANDCEVLLHRVDGSPTAYFQGDDGCLQAAAALFLNLTVHYFTGSANV